MREFIDKLDIPQEEKLRLQKLTPATYIGAAVELVENYHRNLALFSTIFFTRT